MKLKANRRDGECHGDRCAEVDDLFGYAPGVAFDKALGTVWLCKKHRDRRDKERKAEKAPSGPGAALAAPAQLEQAMAAKAKSAAEMLALIQAYSIDCQEDLDDANRFLEEVKAEAKAVEAEKKKATVPANEVLKVIRGWFRPAEDFLAKCEAAWKDKIMDGRRVLDERQRAALAAAQEAHKAGDLDGVAQAMAVAAQATVELPANLSEVERWAFEITDAALLPREYLVPDTARIGAVVAAMKKDTAIPGVRAFPVSGLSQRRGA